ncbi:MAG: amino acid adenylation domain-containing protein [Chitinophagaceae bacterium]|nr:amino acid adenylation domain-containing protein [Chitinophagaceae bacterium]
MHHSTLSLHPAQWDVYTDQLLNVESPHYNIGGYIKLKGILNTEKFREAVTAGPRFFDAFRMRFDTSQSEAIYYLHEDFNKMDLAELDFSNAESPEQEAMDWMKIQFDSAFVLDKKNTPFAQFLIRISADEHWFFGKYHHLIIDGYGFIVWAQYIGRKYKSLVTADNLEFSYPGYQAEAVKAFNYYKSEEYESEGRYWKEKFTEKPEKLLQRKNHFQTNTGKKSTTYSLNLPEDDRKIFEDIQAKTKSGLQQLTIAALLIHYGKSSDHSAFTFGIPVHKRGSRELRNTIGMFSGILPFKGSYQKDDILIDLIKAIGQSQKKDYRHQHYLIGDLSRHLKLNSAEGYLCDIIVNHEQFNFNLNFGEEMQATIFRLANEYEVNPLQICWQDYGLQQPLQLHLHFRHDYFSKEEIELLAQRLLYILRQFQGSLDTKIESIDIIPVQEKNLLEKFNDTAAEYQAGKTIIDLFEDQVKQYPEDIAVVHGQTELTYRELNERSNQLAHYLRSRGVDEESLVPVCVERSLEMIIGVLGILKAGAAYVPIDPGYPEERIRYMLEDTKSRTIITSKQSKARLLADQNFDTLEIDADLPGVKKESKENPEIPVSTNQLAYVIYTSGSTGKPKGVMIAHGNVYAFICWCQQEFSSSHFETVYAGTSLCFDLSVFEIFYPLSVGKRIRILENGLEIAQFLPLDKNVLTNSVPTVIQSLLKEGTDFSNISVMNMAGEPIPFQVQQGLDAEKIEIRNLYGPTEDTTYSTVYRLKNDAPILIGKPIGNTQIHIVDKQMNILPIGATGEICIGGAGLAKGYLDRSELTAEKFIANRFSKELNARLYRTGDLGKWLPDGNIEYQGRLDDQVKIHGYRIELGEIETVLQKCELINEAVVLAREDKEGSKRLVGYIVPDWRAVKVRERELYHQQVSNWKEVYENEYEKTELNCSTDPEFNTNCWNDSFAGGPIPGEQMKEWLDDITQLILSENPENLLDIGCGTGLVYFQLAGKIRRYIGVDFSTSAINHIHHRISEGSRYYGETKLQVCAAHEVSLSEKEQVDTILLNSVIQYFPGEDYLNDIIGAYILLLKGKGRIIIGDVRDNRLLELFKARLLLPKSHGSLSVREFKWAVDQEVLKEEELCFSPEYFYRLQSLHPQITHVEIQWKNSLHINELTLYRYNVVIYVGLNNEIIEPEWQQWEDSPRQQILDQLQAGVILALKDVPNPRLWKERSLTHSMQVDSNTVNDLLETIQTEDKESEFVDEILKIARANGYQYRFFLDEDPLKINLLLEQNLSKTFVHQVYSSKGYSNRSSYSNNPMFTNISALLQKDIRAFLQQQLPDYMIPGLLVELDQLPLTPNGKIDKKALPNPDIELIGSEYVAPRNVLESKLADIWKEVLEIEKVGIYDNFFELGGHSLKAIQLISRLHKRLNIKTDIGKILSNPTIKELAHILALEKPSVFSEIPILPQRAYYELSHAQKRIWVVSYFKDGSTIYNAPGAYLIKGNLQVAAFKAAFDKLIQRHENLRTVFIQLENEPRQKILSLPETGFEIQEIDLRSKLNHEEVIKKWLEDDAALAFDLEKGPLLRATLFQTGYEKYILGFNIHHIISDGWSKGILIKEFLSLYENIITGTESKLPELPIQYKDYAAWHDASYIAQQQHWKRLYEKEVPVLNFPTDFERPKILSFDGAMVELSVAESLTQSLKKMAAGQGATVNNLLFSLYGLLVAKQSNQSDVIIGSLVSGRSHADLENLVGVFINFLPIKLSASSGLCLQEYLNQSYQSLTQGYSNQDYPFDLMVDNWVRKRDVSRNPFFDTMVNFHSENDLQSEVQFREGQATNIGVHIEPLDLLKKDLFQSVLDFKLDIEITGDLLSLSLSYNSRLFSRERMEFFLAEYVELLTTAVCEPLLKLDEYLKLAPEKDGLPTNQSGESALLAAMIPVNICASFVAEPLQESLEYWSNELELPIKLAFAPYNQVFQQLLNPESLLHKNTGINVLFIRLEDWLRDRIDSPVRDQIGTLNQTYAELIDSIGYAQKSSFVPFLIGIVPLQTSHAFSNEVADYISDLNQKLHHFFGKLPRFYTLDLDKIASLYNVNELFDNKADELGHIPFTEEYYAAIGTFIMRKIRAYKGPSYKVIALDCDNTLWKGVCGELGAMNVSVDENYAYMQEFLLEKYNQGFLLALCSKNNEEDVWEVFDRNPQMKLKREHIAAYQINWNPKPGNLVSISAELNLGLNSIVFIDDSEFEIEQTTLGCPDVLSLVLPEDEPGSFPDFLNHVWALDHFQVTEEDMKRNTMYKAEKQRKEEQVKYASLKDFLQSLNIKVNIRSLEEKDLERAVQLTLRTNQFNLNGVRKSPEEIAKSIAQQNTVNWIIEVKDRFGDYGIAGLLLARVSQNTLILETFLLSCRVLGRNVEEVILNEIRNYCIVHGLHNVLALYQPTSKNKPFINFLTNSDWQLNSQTNNYSLFIKTSEHELLLK